LWVLVFVCCLSASLLAQDTASITGTVTDQTGAAIPNAQVAITNPEHGIKRTTASNGAGDYLISTIPPGTYQLTITATGFKKYEAPGIILRIAQKARADATLQIGAEGTEVTIQGAPVAAVETQTNELAGTITGKEISQLQLNGRVFTSLVTLTGNQQSDRFLRRPVRHYYNVNYSVNGGRLVTTTGNWTAATTWITAAMPP
jgi:hypothetical protein